MATRLYLHNLVSDVVGRPTDTATVGEGDLAHAGIDRLICKQATQGKGEAQYELEWTEPYPDPAEDHHCLLGIWLCPPWTKAQTILEGAVFDVAAALEANLPDNPGFLELRVFAYLWRPGVGWVATLTQASASDRSLVETATRVNDAIETFFVTDCSALGANVEAMTRDRIAVELWAHFHVDEGGAGGPAAYRAYWDGTDDSKADGETIASAASYVNCSQTLTLESEMDTANFVIGGRDLEVNDVNVGALTGEVVATYTQEVVIAKVNQRLGAVKADKVSHELIFRATLMETTLENLRIATNLAAANLSTGTSLSDLRIGNLANSGTNLAGTKIEIIGTAPGSDGLSKRTFAMHKGIVRGDVTQSMTKEGYLSYSVEFYALEDPTQPADMRLGYWRDENDVAFTFAT